MNPDDYQKAKQGLLAADLSGQAKWKLTGSDRIRYLNGQTTCDVTRLKPGESILGAVTNLKGKLEGSIRISAAENALFVDTEPALGDSLFARLNKYIIADDVELADVGSEWRLYHFLTINPVSPDSPFAGQIPCVQSNRFGLPGWDLWIPSDRDSVDFPVECADPNVWETLRIENAVPRWGVDMDQNNLAPEMPFERLGGLSYSKGCYIGQEVIARIRSRGHVNKQLCLLHSEESCAFEVPQDCYQDNQCVGKATSLCLSPANGGTAVLATLSRSCLERSRPVVLNNKVFQITSI